jgi:hypothetical protein
VPIRINPAKLRIGRFTGVMKRFHLALEGFAISSDISGVGGLAHPS